MKTTKNDLIMQNKIFIWIGIATGVILMIPLIAMQFTSEVNWNLADFIVMGLLLLGFGSTFVAVARLAPRKYRLLISLLFIGALLWLWAELAVGIFTNWGS